VVRIRGIGLFWRQGEVPLVVVSSSQFGVERGCTHIQKVECGILIRNDVVRGTWIDPANVDEGNSDEGK
jgi:hypothetical protein